MFKMEQEPHPSLISIISFNTDTVSISVTSTDPPYIANLFYTLSYNFIHTHKFTPIPTTDRHEIITSIFSYTFDYRIIMI